ncbi:MAG: hypothetical protein ACOC1K_04270, partial [Nanoarchaeota archaeon]
FKIDSIKLSGVPMECERVILKLKNRRKKLDMLDTLSLLKYDLKYFLLMDDKEFLKKLEESLDKSGKESYMAECIKTSYNNCLNKPQNSLLINEFNENMLRYLNFIERGRDES